MPRSFPFFSRGRAALRVAVPVARGRALSRARPAGRRCRRSSRSASCTETLRRDEVAPAKLGRVDADLGRRVAHQPLDHVRDVGPARAAIRRDRRGIGDRETPAAVERGDRVDAGQAGRRVADVAHRPGGREIGAHVGDPVEPEREEAAVRVERELAVDRRCRGRACRRETLRCATRPISRACPSLSPRSSTAQYSPYAVLRWPKPPPTSRAITRNLSSGSFVYAASWRFIMFTPCTHDVDRVAVLLRDRRRRGTRAAPSGSARRASIPS